MMRDGRVTVDGEIVTELGTKVSPRATDIRVDGKVLHPRPMRYILLNKPPGYITTTNDERGRPTVLDLVQTSERVFPVGRLDRATEGLLLLTNDGDVANRVMHPRYKLAKEYHVLTLSRPPDPILQRVRDGIVLDGRRIVPSDFRILRETREGLILTIVLHEGMHHVVRRLMEEVGIEVDRLRRVRVGPLTLQGLPLGGSRDLSTGERANLFEAIQLDREMPGEKHDAPTRDQSPRPSIKTRERRRSRSIRTSPLPRDK
jgi:23S rRNA pseudouridine2605 synthase